MRGYQHFVMGRAPLFSVQFLPPTHKRGRLVCDEPIGPPMLRNNTQQTIVDVRGVLP